MSSDIVAAEFNLWLENLNASTSAVASVLQTQPISVEDLRAHFDEMEVDASQLESFRPVSKKSLPYDFTTALPTLATAKRLAARANHVLVKAGDITPTPQPTTSENIARKIPEVEITPFDGDITQFTNFMKAFDLKFGSLRISKSEKLQHLRKLTTGGPHKVIAALDITDDNYDRAIGHLKTEYDNEDEVINALYRKLETLPTAKDNTASIKSTYYEVEGLLSALESHGHNIEKFPPLRDRVYFRYPLRIVERICFNTKVTIKEFQSEILKHVHLRTSLEAASMTKTNPTSPALQQPTHSVTASLVVAKGPAKKLENKPMGENKPIESNYIPTCAFCAKRHYSADCSTHTTLAARRPLVKDRCYLCLNKYHIREKCPKTVSCRYCRQVNRHHASLCPQQFGQMTPTAEPQPKKPVGQTEANTSTNSELGTTAASSDSSKETYFVRTHQGAHVTALLTVQNPDTKRKYQIRALFDNGSNESYITENAARRIGLKLSSFRTVPVSVFLKSQPINLHTASTSFTLTNNDDFHVNVVADTTKSLPQNVHLFNYDAFKELYPHHADKRFIRPAETEPIEMLLGSDYFYDILEEKITVTEGLYLYATKFGWLLVGRQASVTSNKATFFQMSPAHAVKEICDLEALGIKEMPISEIEEEERALQQFYENIAFKDGRYEIRWPWRQYPPDLPDNFGLVIGRLKTQQRKLTEKTFQEYNSILETQINAGIVEEVPPTDNAVSYYLPHHLIITPEKSTSVRMVLDGSAKTKNKNSINDAIYKGINLLSKNGEIIIRFRLNKVAVVSDLEKAFHALGIHPFDRNFVKFLWLWDFKKPASGKNLRILRFMRVVFGIIASPFLLNATIRYHLQKYKNKLALQIIRDIYADNIITGFLTLLAALAFYQFAVEAFNDCSMNLRKWATNDNELRAHFLQPDTSPAISVLGIIWNQYTDNIHLKPITTSDIITLRSVLSNTAQFYDPCGWWSPILINAKIFIRDLHMQYGWDDEIAENQREKWQEISTQLQLAAAELLPRFQCDINDSARYSLHVFTDASVKACACVVYLRRNYHNEISTHLIFSKTKLAKISNVPKLELIAALLGVKTLEYVRDALKITFERQVLWCDSKCVLNWLSTDKILPVFIQQRINYMRNVPHLEKRYVCSKENSADLPSRGSSVQQLKAANWFGGPLWLQKSEENWPPIIPATSLEMDIPQEPSLKPETMVAVITTPKYPFEIDPNRFNSYLKLLRITQNIMKFLVGFKFVKEHQLIPVSPTLASAQFLWIKQEQQNHYYDVIEALRTGKKHPLILKLNLYLDSKEIIRCAGRFAFAPLSPNERNPILLPITASSQFVVLLIQFYHTSNFHAGVNYVLHILRRKYWIPAGRRSLYHIIQKCPKCKRYTSRPYQQPQHSDLPAFRLEEHVSPFQNVGIDTFGPLWSHGEKRYVLLLTDLVIRAIDLELLDNMSTEEIFLAFRRVIARRSTPSLIVSDNAPQFKALQAAFENIYTHDWKWKNTPEHSPWMGGAYERLVGLTKNALLRTFHNITLTDTLIRTALAEIAAMLNNRPLTYVSSESEFDTLTPNHFLKTYFKEVDIAAITTTTTVASEIVALAKYSQEIGNRFWASWRTTYLQHLREKGFSPNNKFSKKPSLQLPKLNEVVLISETNIKRNKWKLGKVVRLHPSADGQIRSISLQTSHGILIRPLNEVYPLELSDIIDTGAQVSTATQPTENEHEDEWDQPEITVEEIYD